LRYNRYVRTSDNPVNEEMDLFAVMTAYKNEFEEFYNEVKNQVTEDMQDKKIKKYSNIKIGYDLKLSKKDGKNKLDIKFMEK